jgi:hypothetical protein
MVPLILIFLATGAAAVVAYGTHPDWVVYSSGMSIITASHRLQWPLTFLAVALCVALVALVASGKRRIFWMLGLAPVGALLFHHFRADPLRTFAILDNPPFVSAVQAGNLVADEDYVVGLQLGDTAYAYPYSLLYANPVVLHIDRGKRVLLMWSPFANRARASLVDRDVRSGELAIVSMPANAILVYNSRLGQFINGVTGMTTRGTAPSGFVAGVPTVKTTWKQWRTAHPGTKVLAASARYAGMPRRAVQPYFKTPVPAGEVPANARITVINPGPMAVAVKSEQVTRQPLNLVGDAGPPLLVFRDEQAGVVRAFDRRFDPDVAPDFRPISDAKRPGVALVDSATNTGWSLAGRVVDGDQRFRGMKLTAVSVDEDLPYGVMKFWYPGLVLQSIRPEDYATAVEPSPPAAPARVVTPRRRTTRR